MPIKWWETLDATCPRNTTWTLLICIMCIPITPFFKMVFYLKLNTWAWDTFSTICLCVYDIHWQRFAFRFIYFSSCSWKISPDIIWISFFRAHRFTCINRTIYSTFIHAQYRSIQEELAYEFCWFVSHTLYV